MKVTLSGFLQLRSFSFPPSFGCITRCPLEVIYFFPVIRLKGYSNFLHSHFFQNVCDLLFDHTRNLNPQFYNPPHLFPNLLSTLPHVLLTSKTKFKIKRVEVNQKLGNESPGFGKFV